MICLRISCLILVYKLLCVHASDVQAYLKQLMHLSSFVEASFSTFCFNFYQVLGLACVEGHHYNRGISSHELVRYAFPNDVPNGMNSAGVENLEFNFLVADSCPSITIYNSCVLDAVRMKMGIGSSSRRPRDLINRMRRKATVEMTTDEILALTRG